MTADRQIGSEANPEVQRQRARQQHLLKPSEYSLQSRSLIEQALADRKARYSS